MQKIRTFLVFFFGLFIAVLPIWWALFDSSLVYLYRDVSAVHLPAKQYLLETLFREGRLPLWNYRVWGGSAFLGDSGYAPLYPLNFIFLLSNLARAYLWFWAAQVALLFWGAFLFFRQESDNFSEALLKATAAASSAYVLSTASLPQLLAGWMAVFWFLWAWQCYLRHKSFVWLWGASIFLALPVYAGDPQFSLLCGLLLFLCGSQEFGRKKYFGSLCILLFLSVLVAAAQLVPAVQLTLRSARGFNHLSLAEAEAWSVHPLRALEYFFPLIWGAISDLNSFKAQPYLNGLDPIPFIQSLYLGAVPILMFFVGLPRILQNRRLLLVTLLAAVLLTMGSFAPLPLNRFFIHVLPLWHSFRFPERLAWLPLFLLLWQIRLSDLWNLTPRSMLIGLFSASMMALAGIFLPGERQAYLQASGLVALTLAIIACKHKQLLKSQGAMFAIMAVIIVDSALVAEKIFSPQPQEMVSLAKVAQDIQKNLQSSNDGSARRMLASSTGSLDWQKLRSLSLDDSGRLSFHAWYFLSPNIPSYWGLEDAFGFSAIVDTEKQQLFSLRATNQSHLLNTLGVRYILGRGTDGSLQSFENPHALPYLFCAANYTPVKSFAEALRVLAVGNLPLETDLLQQKVEPCSVEILERNSRGMRFRWQGDGPHLLVWNESFAPEWKLYSQQKQIPLYRFAGNGMAAFVEGPADEMEFHYENPLLAWAYLATLLTLLLPTTWLAFRYISTRRRLRA